MEFLFYFLKFGDLKHQVRGLLVQMGKSGALDPGKKTEQKTDISQNIGHKHYIKPHILYNLLYTLSFRFILPILKVFFC